MTQKRQANTALSTPLVYDAYSSPASTFVVWVSDTHCGHSAAIVNPALEIEYVSLMGKRRVWAPTLNPAQEFLWALYDECLTEISAIVGSRPLIVLHGGDVCHGHRHPDGLMFSQRDWQLEVGLSVMEPWFTRFPNLQALRMMIGTEAHNWGEGSLEMILMRRLAERHPEHDVRPIIHGRGAIGDLIVDCAHHGPGAGIREWTDGNQLRYYMRSLILGEQRRNRQPPGLILRGHFHDFTWETDHYMDGDQIKTAHAFIAPSWSVMNFYAKRATKSQANQDFGLILLEVKGDSVVRVWPMVKFVDLRTTERWL